MEPTEKEFYEEIFAYAKEMDQRCYEEFSSACKNRIFGICLFEENEEMYCKYEYCPFRVIKEKADGREKSSK